MSVYLTCAGQFSAVRGEDTTFWHSGYKNENLWDRPLCHVICYIGVALKRGCIRNVRFVH